MAHTEHAASGPGDADPADLPHLRRCVELAAEAVDAGDFPFGSVLVSADGRVLAEDRNRESTMGDATRHPEIELARWAAANMTAADRAAATVFTSGEHCPMCSAAHAWVGLGRIVYVSSSEQLTAWLAELGRTSVSGPRTGGRRGRAWPGGAGTGARTRRGGPRVAPPLPQLMPPGKRAEEFPPRLFSSARRVVLPGYRPYENRKSDVTNDSLTRQDSQRAHWKLKGGHPGLWSRAAS